MNRIRIRAFRRSGFTLVELMFSAMILLLVVGCLTQALSSLSNGATYAGTDSELQTQAERALRAIIANLKPSGFATVGGNAFPYLFEDGAATGAYAASAHPPATHTAQAGDPDFGPNQELVFVVPADADGDNRPDLDANGQMVWSAEQHSFVVITRPDGTNVLQQRIDGGSIRTIAHHIERIRFDDSASSGYEIPLRAIRVRIWLRERDEKGALHRYFTEAVVKLRNG